jgi:hypothetical protein
MRRSIFEQKPRLRASGPRRPKAAVDGVGRGHLQVPEGDRVTGDHLDDRLEPVATDQLPSPCRDHDGRVTAQAPQRGEIEVVPVEVRDEATSVPA